MNVALKSENYLEDVRHQYETLPYPRRNVQEENQELKLTVGSSLEYLNHYAYGGKIDLENFAVLVAGGGTGDATIHWAEQLRERDDARVVHLDLSEASIEVAKERASIRGLSNIEFMHASLLDLAEMALDEFRHINCSGVLHHLEDPVAGLNALKSVLADDGVINLMVYAYHGRMLVYHMQELMRRINSGEKDVDAQLSRIKGVMQAGKSQFWMQFVQQIFGSEAARNGDHGLYDLFLHPQDRAYTVDQLYDWIDACGLELSHWVDHFHSYKRIFSTEWVQDENLRATIDAKPERERFAILEMMHGDMFQHMVYVSHQPLPAVPNPEDEAMIPSYSEAFGRKDFYTAVGQLHEGHDGQTITLSDRKTKQPVVVNPVNRLLLQQVNGTHTVGDLLEVITRQVPGITRKKAKAQWLAFYHQFYQSEWMLLRHSSLPRFLSAEQMQQRMLKERD